MQDDLFTTLAEFTIDSSSLMDIFNEGSWTSKKVNSGLWKRVEELIDSGAIISHAEVLAEIKMEGEKGEDLFNWAQDHKPIFKPHLASEGAVIRSMSPKYEAFVNRVVGSEYADPWLIAQAKVRNIVIITEEKKSRSPDLAKCAIPNVCDDPAYAVRYMSLFDLTTHMGWTFK
jgi:hypothetical protein